MSASEESKAMFKTWNADFTKFITAVQIRHSAANALEKTEDEMACNKAFTEFLTKKEMKISTVDSVSIIMIAKFLNRHLGEIDQDVLIYETYMQYFRKNMELDYQTNCAELITQLKEKLERLGKIISSTMYIIWIDGEEIAPEHVNWEIKMLLRFLRKE